MRKNLAIILGAFAALLLTASSASAVVMMATWTGTLTYNFSGNSTVGYDTTNAFGLASLEGAAFTVRYTYNTDLGKRVTFSDSDTLTSIARDLPPPVTAVITINGQSLAIEGEFDSTASVTSANGMANFGTRDFPSSGGITTIAAISTEGTIPGLLPSLDDALPTTKVTGYNGDQYLQYEVDNDNLYPNPITVQHAFAYLQPTTLTIGAVPEPVSWAMMLAGFAGIGLMMRKAHRKAALTAA